jgi:hypothetical protein
MQLGLVHLIAFLKWDFFEKEDPSVFCQFLSILAQNGISKIATFNETMPLFFQ